MSVSVPDSLAGFAGVGLDVTIWPGAKIVGRESVRIGNSVIIDDFVFLMGGAHTEIGDFVHIASFASVLGGGECFIGDFVALSSGCRIYSGTDEFGGVCLTNSTVHFPFRVANRSFVRLEKHVMVGANTVVLPGLKLGEGAAVGAGSVVTADCEPWTIYAGSPARPLRERPREKMLALEAELRSRVFDAQGRYIPRAAWDEASWAAAADVRAGEEPG